jgi:hypothetical protein
MTPTAHIAVYSSAAVAAVGIVALIAFCCIQRRRRNRKDRVEAEARMNALRTEDAKYAGMELKEQDALRGPAHTPDGFSGTGALQGGATEYFAKDVPGGVGNLALTSVTPPVYTNPGFGSRGYSPSNVPSPIYAGSGNQNDAFGQGIPRVASPGGQSQFGQNISRVGSPGIQNQFGQGIPRGGSPGGQNQFGQGIPRSGSPGVQSQFGQNISRVASPAAQSQFGYNGGFNNGSTMNYPGGYGNHGGINRGMGSQYGGPPGGRF